jgi:hypothetical protein
MYGVIPTENNSRGKRERSNSYLTPCAVWILQQLNMKENKS